MPCVPRAGRESHGVDAQAGQGISTGKPINRHVPDKVVGRALARWLLCSQVHAAILATRCVGITAASTSKLSMIDTEAHNARMTEQPCAACDRDTAPGSPLFAGRRRGFDRENAEEVLICAACVADSRAHGARGNSYLNTIALADIFLTSPGG